MATPIVRQHPTPREKTTAQAQPERATLKFSSKAKREIRRDLKRAQESIPACRELFNAIQGTCDRIPPLLKQLEEPEGFELAWGPCSEAGRLLWEALSLLQKARDEVSQAEDEAFLSARRLEHMLAGKQWPPRWNVSES